MVNEVKLKIDNMNGKTFIYVHSDESDIIHYCRKFLRNFPLTGGPNVSPSSYTK